MKIDKPRDYVVKSLQYAFQPASIAVVGASDNPGKVGFQVIHGLRRYRYGGEIYPVNDHADRIQGLKVYRELKAIPDPIDLLFVAVRYDKVRSVSSRRWKSRCVWLLSPRATSRRLGGVNSRMSSPISAAIMNFRCWGPICWAWVIPITVSIAASPPFCRRKGPWP